MKVFIVGSSIIKRAYYNSLNRPGGSQLCLDRRGFSIYWRGQGGMSLDNVVYHVEELQKMQGIPDVLLIHCGGNDIGQGGSLLEICELVKGTLKFIKQLLPHTLLVWSQILPRYNWRSEFDSVDNNRARLRINRAAAHTTLKDLGGCYLTYPEISLNTPEMFLGDGVHLSDLGNNVFLNYIQGAIETFTSRGPGVYP